jgi:hypothetical protein
MLTGKGNKIQLQYMLTCIYVWMDGRMAASLPPGDRALLRHSANLNDDIDKCLFQSHQFLYLLVS